MIRTVIVEDDPMVVRINRQYLEPYPQICVEAVFTSSRDAWQYVSSQPPDLLILDVYMPFMSGLELLQKMRTEGVGSDVIMVTAANDVELVNRALQLGITDYLIKPFEKPRFCEAVEKYLLRRNLLLERQVLNQQVVDRLIHHEGVPAAPLTLRKGLSSHTLSYICQYMADATESTHTCSSIAEALGLSQVTVRHYLSYLAETGRVTSMVDYETGGRPSMRYSLR